MFWDDFCDDRDGVGEVPWVMMADGGKSVLLWSVWKWHKRME